MKKVQILTIYAGPLGTFGPGDTAELPDGEAKVLIAAGSAKSLELPEPVNAKEESMAEAASVAPAENASAGAKRGRPRKVSRGA